MSSEIPSYYILDDGRVWCVAAAAWIVVDDAAYQAWLATGHACGTAPDTTGACSEIGLRDALVFYGIDLGALQTLGAAVTAKTTAIQTEKCKIRDAGFEVDGVLFDSDQAARLAYMEFALSLAQDASYVEHTWKASEGVWVSMDAALFANVKAAGAAALKAAFDWQKARDAEVATIQAAVTAGTMTDADARKALAAVSTTYTAEAAS